MLDLSRFVVCPSKVSSVSSAFRAHGATSCMCVVVRLKSLVGLQRCRSMVELYVGNNRIVNLREIFVLKNLLLLGILDLFGNPVVSTAENYRLFVIYHLKALKALDGTAIVRCHKC